MRGGALQIFQYVPKTVGVLGIGSNQCLMGRQNHLPFRSRVRGQWKKFGPVLCRRHRSCTRRLHGEEVVQAKILKQVDIPRADIEGAQGSLPQGPEVLGDAGERSHEGRVHVFAGGEIDDKEAIAAPDHGFDEFLQGGTSLEISPTFDPDPDFPVETSNADGAGGAHA